MAMTLEEIDAAIAAIEAAKRARLTGKQRSRINASEGGVEYAMATLEEMNQELALLGIKRRKLTGERSSHGPIGIVMTER